MSDYDQFSYRPLFKLNDKEHYEGECLIGTEKPQGYGFLFSKYSDGRDVLIEGLFKNGKIHGYGREIFDNGDTYEGTFDMD
jgi:hypothetical protein